MGNQQKNIYIIFAEIRHYLGEVVTYFDVLLYHEVCTFSSVISLSRQFVIDYHGYQIVNPGQPNIWFISEYVSL